jgi:hypothetical protein
MAQKPTDLQKALAKKVIRRNTKPKAGNTAGEQLNAAGAILGAFAAPPSETWYSKIPRRK